MIPSSMVWFALLACAGAAFGAEHRGLVRSMGLPIPGASVKATQGDRTTLAFTDESGAYVFGTLASGEWTIQVEMSGFVPASKTVVIPSQDEVVWELEMRSPPSTKPRPGRLPRADFERLMVNRTMATEMISGLESNDFGSGTSTGALQQEASESYLVSGSLSSGLQMPPGMGGFRQAGFGPRDSGAGTFQDGVPTPASNDFGGLRGPSGGPGGGGPPAGGMRGGPVGRAPGGGPPGGGGPGGGPPGGPEEMRGGAEGRPPRPEWMARRGVSAFGNRQGGGRPMLMGRAFFSLNNSALDARPYSITGEELKKSSYAKVRFGVGAGGQLRIPKLIDSKNTFFFANYSGTRSRNPFDQLSAVPTEAERRGDFSQSTARGLVTIYDPTNSQPYPNNVIPSAQISPTSTGLLDYFALPNLSSDTQNYQLVTSVPQNTDDLSLRLNHSLSSRDRLSGSFNLQQRYSETAQLQGYRDTTDGRGISTNIGWSHNLSALMINDVRLEFSRNRTETIPYFSNGPDVATELGIQGTSEDPINNGPPNLSFTNYGALSDSSPSLRRDQAVGFTEGFTWIRDNHTIRLGFEYRRNQINILTDDNGRGSYTFSGLVTSGFDEAGNPVDGTGFDMADMLLGLPQSSTIRYGNADLYFRASNYNIYILDDWRINSSLSLNIGIRYEYSQPLYEKYDRMANLDSSADFIDVSVVTPDTAGPFTGAYPRGLVEPDRNNFSPRIGLAWKPGARSNLVVRAGYGIYHNGSVYDTIASSLGQQPPFATTNSYTTSVSNPLTINEGFLGSATTDIKNTFAVNRGYRVGYAQTWNLTVQKTLPHALVLEVGYLGTKGMRLDVQTSPNQAPPGSPADSEDRRPIPYAVGFTQDSSDANSIYHAGRASLSRRFRRGLSFNAAYTWAKSIDNVSSYGGGQSSVAQNAFDIAAERGLSSFDKRHTLTFGFMFSSPVGDGPSTIVVGGLAGKMLADWTLNGNVSANSGSPLTATVLGNVSNAGGTGVVGSARADSTGQAVDSGGGFFNTLAFAVPAADRYGNASRNTIPGPAFFVLNMSLGRSFPLFGERRSVEFRVEAENLLNTVSYTGLGTTVNAANYGLANKASSMRAVSAHLRFRF